MATFVVAHGAWSAGWAWKKMRPLMQAAGHEFWTPTHTGLGERAHLAHPDVDIIIELIGGIEPARTFILQAIANGKHVVTANKALLAEDGAEIYGAAREYGADLYYEASVAGAIPLLRPLRESLAGDTVHRVLGIVNGTTNFILDLMESEGSALEDALAKATALGYAEADNSAILRVYEPSDS